MIKPIIKFDIVSIVTDIMFLKEKTFIIDYESTDMIDFLLDNKKKILMLVNQHFIER